MRSHLLRFLKSPLGLGLWMLCAFLAAGLSLGGVLPVFAAVPAAFAVGSAATFALLLSPLGARSVVAESGRERDERDARVLGGVAAARKRLSLLRIENEEVKAELDRLVLSAGRYLEASVKGGDRDPRIEDAVLGAVEVVNDYLLALDAAVSAKRSARAGAGAEVVGRTVRALASCADEIDSRLDPTAAASDRAAAREETR